METIQELRDKYEKLTKERNILYNKILKLEDSETLKKFTVGECYLDTWSNNFKKIIAIDCEELISICVDDYSICREFITIESIRDWKKITSEQFKSVYLAVMKDIQDPDLEDTKESNWDVTLKSVVESINNKK